VKFSVELSNFPHNATDAYFKFPFQFIVKGPFAERSADILFKEESIQQILLSTGVVAPHGNVTITTSVLNSPPFVIIYL